MDDRNAWRYGFTPQAEIWNGHGNDWLLAAALIELFPVKASSLLGHTSLKACKRPGSSRFSN